MRFPPLTNAVLTQVAAGAGAEDYDQSPATGAPKWTGTADVLVNDAEVSIEGGDDSSIAVERSMVADDALPVAWARGDTVTYTYRAQTLTGIVQDVKTTTAAGLPGVARITLRRT